MPRPMSSWLSGPEPAADRQESEYPGQALSLPRTGTRSLAGSGRRFAALLIDWLISYGLAGLAMTMGLLGINMLSTAVLVIWFVLGALSVWLFGFTPGQFALGLAVVPIDAAATAAAGAHVGIGRALGRGLLIALVIPALFTDADGRGLQDRFTLTAVVRR